MKAALLAFLVFASCSRAPAEEKPLPAAGETWTLRDNGKRCIVAPCPSWTATSSAGVEREITGLDLTKLPEADREPARQRLLTGKAKARGTIETVPNAGPAGAGTVLVIVELL